MQIRHAQAEIRRAYVGGGPGAFVSGMIWAAAAITGLGYGVPTAFAVLFFGGMLIFPVSFMLERVLFHPVKASPGNPLGRNALESTIAMIGGLFAAWLIMPHDPALVFPLSAIAVGTHYFVFRTVYGDGSYWILGALITAAGAAAVFDLGPMRDILLYAVAVIELAFGVLLTVKARKFSR